MNRLDLYSGIALLVLASCTTGCAEGSKTSSTEQSISDTAKTLPGPTKSTVPVSSDEIVAPRPGNSTVATDTSDYNATDGTYRVYGVDGELATIAERGTWTTRQYKAGDAFGRGFVVQSMDENGVTLRGAHDSVLMPVGADTNLRVIRHELDVVAQPLGKHRFNLDPRAARAAIEANPARPSLEAITLYDQVMQKVGAIPAGSLWAAIDLREGDILATDDSGVLASAETSLTGGQEKVALTIYRGGVAFNRSYEVGAVR